MKVFLHTALLVFLITISMDAQTASVEISLEFYGTAAFAIL
jgi:hypothetical protein